MARQQHESALLSLLLRRNEELAALVEIGKALTSTLNLQSLLGLIMEQVGTLLRPKTLSLLLIDEKTEELVFEIAVSPDAENLRGVRLTQGEGIAGWVALHGEPLLIPDTRHDERFNHAVDKAISFTTHSIVCVPLKSKERILGVIQLINSTEEQPFTPTDLQILTTMADYAAIAIENARNFEKIHQLAITDDLTGLYNARHFLELVDYEIERARRYKFDLSLVFIDLDFFKNINDTHGHLVGSRMLKEIGQLIQKLIRRVDIAARYGGDEYVIMLPNTSKAGAITMATNLRLSIRNHLSRNEDGSSARVTASIGIASYPGDAGTKLELIQLADKAMYHVKETTRDAVWAC